MNTHDKHVTYQSYLKVEELLACALYGGAPDYWVRPGPQLGPELNNQRVELLNEALTFHRGHLSDPLESLRCLGHK